MPLAATDYIRPPRTNVVQALGLALALLRRVPKDVPEAARKAAKRLRAETQELQRRRRARKQAPAKKVDSRVANEALDTAWSALRDGLAAVARLPRAHFPASAQAQALLDRVFPEALAFLKQDYNAVWVESDELLRALREEGLTAEIGQLVHASFVAAVERAHKDFGDVIGMTAETQPAAPAVDLAEALARVHAALSAYAVQMVAAADDADEATVARVRHALEPIVEQRGRSRKRAKDAVVEEPADDDADEAPANDADGEVAEEAPVTRVA